MEKREILSSLNSVLAELQGVPMVNQLNPGFVPALMRFLQVYAQTYSSTICDDGIGTEITLQDGTKVIATNLALEAEGNPSALKVTGKFKFIYHDGIHFWGCYNNIFFKAEIEQLKPHTWLNPVLPDLYSGSGKQRCMAGNLRTWPSTTADSLGEQVQVVALAQTTIGDRIWYLVQQVDTLQIGWAGLLSQCVIPGGLPEIDPYFDPRAAATKILGCEEREASGCVQIRDVTLLFGGLSARTHPSAPGEQLGGRKIVTLRERTIWTYSAVRPDIEGCWYQISLGYGQSAWVKDFANGIQNLIVLPECPDFDHMSEISEGDINLGEPISPIIGSPGDCSDQIPGWPQGFVLYPTQDTDLNKVAFILNCEAGGDIQQARNIAEVIRSRMIIGDASAVGVVQSSEWDCFTCGSRIPWDGNAEILALAEALVRLGDGKWPLDPLPESGDLLDDIESALYTVGVHFPEFINDLPEEDEEEQKSKVLRAVIGLYRNTNPDRIIRNDAEHRLQRIYVGATGPNGVGFITVFFTSFPILAIFED